MALVCGYMWRLRRRAAGRCTGPYAGAAVGAMYGPCRRRVSGDAAVARVVVCTGARPLVRILVRGGVVWLGREAVRALFAIHWAAVQFVLRVRCSELAFALKVVPLVPVML